MSGKAWSVTAEYGPTWAVETSDGWRVGRCVMGAYNRNARLLRVDVTGELLWVNECDLQPYPASPIEQPKTPRTAKKARRT